ncbi:MAG: alpha/beta-type small acid-soluble spore protein [Candidatus Carbobacillus altaicus]|nr:alpha/beta-type small acid-soluble spore protein [Candidatus Carbobacillus altaicus]
MARRRVLNPKVKPALDRLKVETARELGLDDDIETRGYANMTTHEVGKIGGNMVRKMIRMAQMNMAKGSKGGT